MKKIFYVLLFPFFWGAFFGLAGHMFIQGPNQGWIVPLGFMLIGGGICLLSSIPIIILYFIRPLAIKLELVFVATSMLLYVLIVFDLDRVAEISNKVALVHFVRIASFFIIYLGVKILKNRKLQAGLDKDVSGNVVCDS